MEVFAPDPVDEMAARVRARWSAADRRRTNGAWWCADTATVPRTPPEVLMDALADEFDAYAAHRRSVDCASVTPRLACGASATPGSVAAAAASTRSCAEAPRPDRRRLWAALALGALAVVLVLLLVGLALAPAWRARDRQDAGDDDPAVPNSDDINGNNNDDINDSSDADRGARAPSS